MITANDFLEEVYDQLEYKSGYGYYSLATDSSHAPSLSQISWLDQARQLGAETIFFVDDFPTVLFFKHDTDLDTDTTGIEERIRQLFLRVWNTSRVPLFFVALPGELRVYSAYQKPTRQDEWLAEDRWLKRIKTIAQVMDLVEFSRPQVESGNLFQQRTRDFKRENRVDQWLLKNLRLLRQKLEGGDDDKREFVHALIGRSIFIRYLEDRKVLVDDYFTEIDGSQNYQCYTDVLTSKDATYHLFRKLRIDFNGDLFPLSNEEDTAIEETDLLLLRDFLRGRSMGDQPDLLFWAYKFDIIPIELISNIYEEFYHENGAEEDKGTHYTPTPLVDFVLSQSLTVERLDAGARVLDAACGSGIFLVEAFKRMVYHTRRQRGVEQLSRTDLVELLTEKVVGFDINHSAIQVAAFSLYLAYLDFREPPDIRANKRLPKLIYDPKDPETSGKSLFHTNTFFLTKDEKIEIEERIIVNKKPYPGKTKDISASQLPILPIDDPSFDVIIGNSPWGSDNSPDGNVALQWCKAFRYPVGDRELSQCFIWRLQRLVNPGGEIGLLVSTGIFFKHQKQSQDFRKKWLLQNQIRAVYNFAHVRRVFFQGAIAPFAAIFFAPAQTESTTFPKNKTSYVSIKRQAFVEQMQAIIIERDNLFKIRQSDFLISDWLWKTYMWGNSNDAELIEELKSCYPFLKTVIENQTKNSGRGFGDSTGKHSTNDLGVNYELSNNDFDNSTPFSELVTPLKQRTIRRIGNTNLYKGDRLIIKRGVSKSAPKYGAIQARLANASFAFTDNFFGFRLDMLNDVHQKMLLGITISSLARYYQFLTCSMWGLWLDKIHINEFLNMPIYFSENTVLQKRIVYLVNQIQANADTSSLFDLDHVDLQKLQNKLDEAIFDLYELSESQRDLVRDLCQVTLEFFYDGTNTQAVKSPSIEWLESYKDAFFDVWQDRLAARGKELEIKVFAPQNGLLIGMAFELVDLETAQVYKPVTDHTNWQRWFRKLSRLLLQERSSQIYIDRTIKVLTDSSIFIVKRAERRSWTKSMARQDAQELLTEVFRREWQSNGETA